MWGYRAADVARMLDLPVEEVRRLARDGLRRRARRGPRNELLFSFQDLVLLRAAAGLVHARVPRGAGAPRARGRSGRSFRTGRSLAAVRVAADGVDVVVQDGGARWRPETGQVLLDFEVRDLARKVAPHRRGRPRARGAAAPSTPTPGTGGAAISRTARPPRRARPTAARSRSTRTTRAPT